MIALLSKDGLLEEIAVTHLAKLKVEGKPYHPDVFDKTLYQGLIGYIAFGIGLLGMGSGFWFTGTLYAATTLSMMIYRTKIKDAATRIINSAEFTIKVAALQGSAKVSRNQ